MSGNTLDLSSQGALDRARNEGWRVVVPSAFELFVDIDDAEAFSRFELAATEAMNLGFISGWSARPSKSGDSDRQHIIVRTPEKVTPLMRIALQAILGSDWLRELRGLERLRRDDAIPTLFFEKP